MKRIFCSVALAAVCVALWAAFPAKTDRFVNDFADVFGTEKAEQVAQLEEYLANFSDSTTNQVVIVTVSDLDGYESSDYAQRLGQAWGVGSRQNDNGVLILLKPRNENGAGAVEIATGYGAEGALPDSYCGRILDQLMLPHIRAGRFFEACEAGARACCEALRGEYNEVWKDESAGADGSFDYFFLLLALLLVPFLLPSKKRKALDKIANATSVSARDKAIAEAKKLKVADWRVRRAVKKIPSKICEKLTETETPEQFERMAVSALALGVAAATIDKLRSEMPHRTLNALRCCSSKSQLGACKARALAFGNSGADVEAAVAAALLAIAAAARAARTARHTSNGSGGSVGGGHHGFGGGSFGGGGAGRSF